MTMNQERYALSEHSSTNPREAAKVHDAITAARQDYLSLKSYWLHKAIYIA
jgi:hypothetical protein